MAEQAASTPEQTTGALEAAHRRLVAARDLQFDFPDVKPPPPPRQIDWLPDWLKDALRGLGRALGEAGPAFRFVFWAFVVLAVLALLFIVARELGIVAIKRDPRAKPADFQYRPDENLAKALLADADALAAEGRYGEAVHVLLLRSIEDLRQRRPKAVAPALTSRDIAALSVLPEQARAAFSAMARMVEAGLFGGRPTGPDDFATARRAYEAFAFPQAWA